MSEKLKVSYELTGNLFDWDSPESIEARNAFTLAVLEDECRDDPDSSRLERLKEFWLIKIQIK